eukprot:2484739-Pleurochrysis_carterae.AAC.1
MHAFTCACVRHVGLYAPARRGGRMKVLLYAVMHLHDIVRAQNLVLTCGCVKIAGVPRWKAALVHTLPCALAQLSTTACRRQVRGRVGDGAQGIAHLAGSGQGRRGLQTEYVRDVIVELQVL